MNVLLDKPLSSIFPPIKYLLEAVDQMISPVHLFSHVQLRHVHLCIDVLQTVLEVLWQTVDRAVCQDGVVWVQWCKTHIFQGCGAVQIF